MKEPITQLEAHKLNGRHWLRGLTTIGDWKVLAVFDTETEMSAWLDHIR